MKAISTYNIYLYTCTCIRIHSYFISLQVFCIGVLLNSAVALSNIDDIDKEYISDDWEDSDHRRRYRDIAWYLWGVAIAGIAVEITMLLVRGQYLAGNCKDNFITFAVIVSFCIYVANNNIIVCTYVHT